MVNDQGDYDVMECCQIKQQNAYMMEGNHIAKIPHIQIKLQL